MNLATKQISNTASVVRGYSESDHGEVYSFGVYFGKYEICKTEAEALEAAELLKAFFKAKQEGKAVELIIEGDHPNKSFAWQEGYSEGFKNGYDNRKEDARQIAILEARQAQTQPSDYQLRLERYAVDIFCNEKDASEPWSVDRAANIIQAAAEKAREHGTKPD